MRLWMWHDDGLCIRGDCQVTPRQVQPDGGGGVLHDGLRDGGNGKEVGGEEAVGCRL